MNRTDLQRLHQRAKEIIFDLAHLPGSEREVELDRVCQGDAGLRAEVISLLHHVQPREDAFSDAAVASGRAALESHLPAREDSPADSPATLPERLGSYRILSLIGEGGMGRVYEAEQDSPRRIVALKVFRPGPSSRSQLRRFEHEVHVLGRLRHPGIARIYDAGMTRSESGWELPFFAMERIHGLPLHEYARRHNLCMKGRLDLLMKAAEAVQHAHRNGIIHRDLKPANILVEEDGQPKLLDFGVARMSDADLQMTTMHTQSGSIVGTMQYMSPEQVTGDSDAVDTRADVYALGVLGYLLLADRLPYDLRGKSIQEMVQIITTSEPERLAAPGRLLRRDVETIITTALAKDRERRYASAGEFAADIQRCLRGEPILARRASASYQLRMLWRRHRVLFCSIAALVVILAGSTIAIGSLYARSRAEGRRAREAAAKAEQMASFLEETLLAVGPSVARGRDTTLVREILDETVARLGSDLAGQPSVEAELRSTVGNVYGQLAMFERSEEMHRSALALFRHVHGDRHPQVAAALGNLAVALDQQGRYDEAERYYRESLALDHALSDVTDADTAKTMRHFGAMLSERGVFAEAEDLLGQALDANVRLFGREHEEVANCLRSLAAGRYRRGDFGAAEKQFREALDLHRRLVGDDHPLVAMAMGNLATTLVAQGKFDAAEPLMRQTLDLQRRLVGDEHPDVATALNNLAGVSWARRDLEATEELLEEALAIRRRTLGERHPLVALTMNNLARVLQVKGDLEAAESLHRRTIALRREILPPQHQDIAVSLENHAAVLEEQGRLEEAERERRESLEINRHVYEAESLPVARAQHDLGRLLQRSGRHEEAMALLEQSLEVVLSLQLEGDSAFAEHRRALAESYAALDRFEEAEALLLAAAAGADEVRDLAGESASARHLVALYERWHAADPLAGKGEQGRIWRERLRELERASDASVD